MTESALSDTAHAALAAIRAGAPDGPIDPAALGALIGKEADIALEAAYELRDAYLVDVTDEHESDDGSAQIQITTLGRIVADALPDGSAQGALPDFLDF